MNTKNIYFYDRYQVLLDRYPALIANEIKRIGSKSNNKFNFIFIFSDYSQDDVTPKITPIKSNIHYIPYLNINSLNKLTKKHPPHAFICIGLRIPDILLISYFKKLRVKTYMVQHGLFIKHLTRISFLKHFASKFSHFIKYFIYSFHLAKLNQKPFLLILNDLFTFFIKGKGKFIDLHSAKVLNLISDKVFAFDKNWDNYYQNYGYSRNQFLYFGNPDYSLAKDMLNNPIEDSICYICQSLVEDGRYLKKDYLDFLKDLSENLSGRKVYLKLHPRSDLKLYETFENENFILTRDLKNCTTFLGHYSSLIEVSYQLGRNNILWDLKNHTIPLSYIEYSDYITNDFSDLKRYLKDNIRTEFTIKTEMKEFLDTNCKPYLNIAKHVISDID